MTWVLRALAVATSLLCQAAMAGPLPKLPPTFESANKKRGLEVCLPVQTDTAGWLSPEMAATNYFRYYENGMVDGVSVDSAGLLPPLSVEVRVLTGPLHGKITYAEIDGASSPLYTPNKGYKGADKAIYEVTVEGVPVKVVYSIRVTKLWIDGEGVSQRLCKQSEKKLG